MPNPASPVRKLRRDDLTSFMSRSVTKEELIVKDYPACHPGGIRTAFSWSISRSSVPLNPQFLSPCAILALCPNGISVPNIGPNGVVFMARIGQRRAVSATPRQPGPSPAG